MSQLDDNCFTNFSIFDVNANYNFEMRKYLDPIHSYISYSKQIWSIIDTVEFQRLRDIKQLGCANSVFGGATHTRFEHCLGVGHLANKQLKYIFKAQPKLRLENQNQTIKNVTIAGLCHDLGHGPYSHMFELVLNQLEDSDSKHWSHEYASGMLLDSLIDKNNIDFLEQDDVNLIKNLITGINPYDKYMDEQDQKWIFDIVANKRNSIDVDKFDYLQRDSYHVGLKDCYFDYKGIMQNAMVINGELSYNAKIAHKIYELFQARYKMFKGIYLNKVSQGIELMYVDLFANANSVYDFRNMSFDPSQYCYLTDSILNEMERSKNPSLKTSQDILKKIKQRDIFRFVNETLIPINMTLPCKSKIIQDIISFCKSQDGEEKLRMEELRIVHGQINYGFGDKNPVDQVSFFKKGDFQQSFKIPKEQVSLLLPQQFAERYVRLFVTNKDKINQAKLAFKLYCKKILNTEPGQVEASQQIESSPFKNLLQKRQQFDESNISSITSPHKIHFKKKIQFDESPQFPNN